MGWRRRIALALALVTSVGTVASAATIRGTQGADRLVGTPRADTIFGRRGDDRLAGRAGPDLIHGGAGADIVSGGSGNDRVAVETDSSRDAVACGAGRDVVTAEQGDDVRSDCEVVSRQLSRDPYRNRDSEHETEVEPDSFAHGSTIVTAFQAGRDPSGGATDIGFATSSDGGRTWTSGFLPGLTRFSSPPGPNERVSDPSVAYDAVHGVWLIASLALLPQRSTTALLVSRSRDGVHWGMPVAAARKTGFPLGYDKEWIACDSWRTSPFRGRCYLSYTDIFRAGRALRSRIATTRSSDGGITWSPPVATSGTANVFGAQPVARPDGDVVVVFVDERRGVTAARSTNGGAAFAAPRTVARLGREVSIPLRAPPAPSVEVGGDGAVYAAWHDCRFRPRCRAYDIVVASSDDGVSWTRARRIPIGPRRARVSYVIPGLAADPGRTSARARLAVAYYALRPTGCTTACLVDVGLVASGNGGRSWGRARRLSARSMRLPWIVETQGGHMLADYLSTSFVDGRAIPVFSLASEPARTRPRYRQAIFATVPVPRARPGARRSSAPGTLR